MKLPFRAAPIKSETSPRGLKVFLSSAPLTLRVWVPFKHQLFIEYSGSKFIDAYDDVAELSKIPAYRDLLKKNFSEILIKSNKIEIQIKLANNDELIKQWQRGEHPEYSRWLEDMSKIIIAYNQKIKRSESFTVKLDHVSGWMMTYLPLTILCVGAISYPLIASANMSPPEWKNKVQIIVGAGVGLMVLLGLIKKKLWLRIFARFYLIILSGFMLGLSVGLASFFK